MGKEKCSSSSNDSNDEATEDEQHLCEADPIPTNAPGPSAPSQSTSLNQVMEQLSLMHREQAAHTYYTRGMIHQLSKDVYGLYQHQGLNYPPPYDFPPSGFYPMAPPSEFPYLPPEFPYPLPPRCLLLMISFSLCCFFISWLYVALLF